MVEPLRTYEGSTLELIRRRRMQVPAASLFTGMLILVAVCVLPWVKVDLVTTTGGMIRTGHPPAEIISPVSGLVVRCGMTDGRRVCEGDTLVVFHDQHARAVLRNGQALYDRNQLYIRDIQRILKGHMALVSMVYRQSYRDHLARVSEMEAELRYLGDEYRTADTLYRQDVIPRSEHEKIRTSYVLAQTRLAGLREQYRGRLESELSTLQAENLGLLPELEKAKTMLQNHCILAPVDGILQHCSGISRHAAVTAGSILGTVVPSGPLVAECLADPSEIGQIRPGMEAMIRLDSRMYKSGKGFRTLVTGMDADAVIMGGRPVYRVRCLLDSAMMESARVQYGPLLPGMTFTANLSLGRASLASIAMGQLTGWLDPRRDKNDRDLAAHGP